MRGVVMTTYEGWSNYPTWAVNLWLANEYAWYADVSGEAASRVRGTDPAESALPDLHDFARWLEEYAREYCLPDLAAGLVDWREIAEHWLADARAEL